MDILTGAAMRRIDRRTIESGAVAADVLMENAGRGVAEAFARDFPAHRFGAPVVVCGKGNNGGDGLVAARHLAARGYLPRIAVVAPLAQLSELAALNLRRAREVGLAVEEVADEAAWSRIAAGFGRATVVLDALLGTGVQGGARGLVARAIDDVNRSGSCVVSIDLPSGLDADSGALPQGPTILARRTYTLVRPKVCLALDPAASRSGSWRVIDIGIPETLVAAERSDLEWLDRAAASILAPSRPDDAHKGTMGHLLVVAGSRGKSGAAVLAARAALRSGAGLVTIATPRSAQPIVASGLAEAMTEPLAETRRGTLAKGAAATVRRLAATREALAVGPGLGTDAETKAAVRAIVARRAGPLVLDADGLNAFGDRPPSGGAHAVILTPHPGEAARLLGTTTEAIQADRLGAARALAASTGAVVVLKGRRTVVASPGGPAAVNASGNPGLATAGTGDALTGILGALLARRIPAFDAARLGTYVHGAAGDRAAAAGGVEGMIAGDLIEALPRAWREIADREDGGTGWTRGA